MIVCQWKDDDHDSIYFYNVLDKYILHVQTVKWTNKNIFIAFFELAYLKTVYSG